MLTNEGDSSSPTPHLGEVGASESSSSLLERRGSFLAPVDTSKESYIPGKGDINRLDSTRITPENILTYLNSDQKREYQDIFDVIDDDASGEVTTAELTQAFENMEVEMTKEEIKTMVDAIDEDGSGAIDFEEFACVLFKLDRGLMKIHDEEPEEDESKVKEISLLTYIRMQTWALFDDPQSSRPAQFISLFILVLIGVSCTSFVIETLPQFQDTDAKEAFMSLETFCIICFTIEFGFRLFSCPNIITFWSSLLNIIDFVAILPYYIEAAAASEEGGNEEGGGEAAAIRVVRLVRIFRVFKIGRYLTWFAVFSETLKESYAPLGMVVFVISICVVLLASLIFFIEKGRWSYTLEMMVEDDGYTEARFQSIPGTIWFVFSSMTTVGYGDVNPRRLQECF